MLLNIALISSYLVFLYECTHYCIGIIYPAFYGRLWVLGTMYRVQVWKGRKHAYRTLQRCYIEGNRGREFYRAGLNITLCELDLMGGGLLWEHTIYLSYIFIS